MSLSGSRRQTGFTLVELTIVMVVLGISTGLVIPALSGLLAREGEKSTARILMGVLRRARSEAILTGQPWRVDIDWSRGECRLGPDPGQNLQLRPTAARTDAAAKRASTATPSASSAVEAAMAPKQAATIPAVQLPGAVRPRLAMTLGKAVSQPETVSLVVRPEGLCQPAFIRLPGTDGTDVAVIVAAVGCRVEMVSTDLDTAQARFQKSLGLADPPWAGKVMAAGQAGR